MRVEMGTVPRVETRAETGVETGAETGFEPEGAGQAFRDWERLE
jgi:hypothetical protein